MNTSNLDTFTFPKKATKYHKRYLKAFLRRLGLESQFSKFNKTPLFWPFMAKEVVVFDFIQDDFEMAPHILTDMEKFFTLCAHSISYPIPERDLTLTLFEALEMTRRFRHAVRGCLNEGTKVHRLCEEWIEHLWKREIMEITTHNLTNALLLMTVIHSNTADWIYGYKMKTENHPSNPLKLRFKITIQRKKAELYNRTGKYLRRYILLEYGDGDGGFTHQECTYEGKNYPVYCQPHALRRIQERAHVKPHQLHYHALLYVDYKDVRTYGGSYLIPYYTDSDKNYKIGYFVGEFVDDRLLINTFLFLSQDGTPEGDKLNELLKVQKLEKMYLQLDELRYFTNSDLKDDEELLELLKTCHLDHLFELRLADQKVDFTVNADFIKESVQFDQMAVKKPSLSLFSM